MAFDFVFVFLTGLFFLCAMVFSFLLSRETGGERFWVFFFASALAFGAGFFSENFLFSQPLAGEIKLLAQAIGSFSFAYAAYGLYSSMKKIREKTALELEE